MIYNLANLVKIDIITDILQQFHELTGLRSILKDADGNIIADLVKNQGSSPFCSRLYDTNNKFCKESDLIGMEQAIQAKSPLIYKCHAGLTDVVIPLYIQEKFVGAVFTGQFFTHEDKPVNFELLEKKFDLEPGTLEKAFESIPTFDMKVMEFYVNILDSIFKWVIALRIRYLKDLKYDKNQDTNVYDRIEKAIQTINENYSSPLTMKQIAHDVNLSESYFSTSFKEYTGLSFPEYLNKVRLEKARFLLKNTYLSITTIAYDVGYSDSNYFSTIFKKTANLTPKQYREKYDRTCPRNIKILEDYRKKHGFPSLGEFASIEEYWKAHAWPEDLEPDL
ncbi:MAG: PocR ligand-binding domain-containing protein [Spirochaetales bacterium]|nr:PocR ligand-binding domain-containing protein [Spirochaetales bacterium]